MGARSASIGVWVCEARAVSPPLRAGRRVRFRKLHRHLLSANGKTKSGENANRAGRLRRHVVFDESEPANGSLMQTAWNSVSREVNVTNDSIELKTVIHLL